MKQGKIKKAKTEFSFRAPIKNAFEELRKLGYFAKENHTCCNTCGWAEIPTEQQEKSVFYHNQNLGDLRERQGCHLSWSGNGKEIVDVLERHGLKVEWNGSDSNKIHIDLESKKVA